MNPHPIERQSTAARLDYVFDYARITREILACQEFFVDTPPHQRVVEEGLSGETPFLSDTAENYGRIDTWREKGIHRNELRGVKTFYLRNSSAVDATRRSPFTATKQPGHGTWFWRPELAHRIPYTIECIESLPLRPLGLVRVFVCENTFIPTHRDMAPAADRSYDRGKALGISLVPADGGVGMLVWNREARCVEEVRAPCILFDDACWHGVPMTRGTRIALRIFGELELDRLAERIVPPRPAS